MTISAFVSWHIAQKKQWTKIYEVQLEKVYHPVFVLLENYFYKYHKHEKDGSFILALWNADQIIQNNRLLTNPFLYILFENFKAEPKPRKKAKIFNKISKEIISTYSIMRASIFSCGLSIGYIRQKKLYKNYFYFFKVILKNIVFIFIGLTLMVVWVLLLNYVFKLLGS